MALTENDLKDLGFTKGMFGMGGRSLYDNGDKHLIHDLEGFTTIQHAQSGYMRHVDDIDSIKQFMDATKDHSIETMLEFFGVGAGK